MSNEIEFTPEQIAQMHALALEQQQQMTMGQYMNGIANLLSPVLKPSPLPGVVNQFTAQKQQEHVNNINSYLGMEHRLHKGEELLPQEQAYVDRVRSLHAKTMEMERGGEDIAVDEANNPDTLNQRDQSIGLAVGK